jgi:hypothetical protein
MRKGEEETIFYCETCKRKPGLHPGNCFKKYHTQQNYKQKHFDYFMKPKIVDKIIS